VVHNTALNSSHDLSSYPPDNHHSSDDVYHFILRVKWWLNCTKQKAGSGTATLAKVTILPQNNSDEVTRIRWWFIVYKTMHGVLSNHSVLAHAQTFQLLPMCRNAIWRYRNAAMRWRNGVPLGELEETTGTPPYYVDEDYPAWPGITEALPERSNWRGSECPLWKMMHEWCLPEMNEWINQSINFYSGLSDRSHFEDH